ncbi:MAG TPA: YggS family pyridoxal phosphate-dependent enzyme [Fimbriimonas sp.]|nr:YggS family pyridoxal phosphate-dependent enzyme [Fimbriimonas sp.]
MTAKSRLSYVIERIERACESAGRNPKLVTLVAVSKTKTVDQIRELYDLGQRQFGESRLQEALPKIEALPNDIIWHFIGELQSNKAKKVAENFHIIHTIYKESQVREIAKRALAASPPKGRQDVFIEINIGQEPQKAGIFLQELDEILPIIIECKAVQFRGSMTIGPALEDAEQMRPYFRALREANESVGGEWLSMGMSHDFEVALQEGATHIRVGSALFGERT